MTSPAQDAKFRKVQVPGPDGKMITVNVPVGGGSIPAGQEQILDEDLKNLAPVYRNAILFQRAATQERVAANALLSSMGGPVITAASAAPAASRGPEIDLKLDLGKLLTDALAMSKGASNPETVKLQATLEAIQEQLKGGASSPLQTYKEVAELVTLLKKDLGGTPELAAAGVGQLPLLVELEKLKGDREDRQRNHELAMEEERNRWQAEQRESNNRWAADKEDQRRRWEIEDRRWQADQNLTKAKLQQESDKQEKLMGVLGDLFGSATDGLEDVEQSVGSRTASQPRSERVIDARSRTVEDPPPREVGFPCAKCGTVIKASSDARPGDSVPCPNCGEGYVYKDSGAEEET